MTSALSRNCLCSAVLVALATALRAAPASTALGGRGSCGQGLRKAPAGLAEDNRACTSSSTVMFKVGEKSRL